MRDDVLQEELCPAGDIELLGRPRRHRRVRNARKHRAPPATEGHVDEYTHAFFLRQRQHLVARAAVADGIVHLQEVELVLCHRIDQAVVLVVRRRGNAHVADLAGSLVITEMRIQIVHAIQVVDLQQVDPAHLQAAERVIQHGGAARHAAGKRCLGGEEELVAIADLRQQPADHDFGLTVTACGVNDRATEARHRHQHALEFGRIFGAIGIRAHAHRRQLFAGGWNGLQYGSQLRRRGSKCTRCGSCYTSSDASLDQAPAQEIRFVAHGLYPRILDLQTLGRGTGFRQRAVTALRAMADPPATATTARRPGACVPRYHPLPSPDPRTDPRAAHRGWRHRYPGPASAAAAVHR